MPNLNLDSIDVRLLAELQADGRVTNVDLASKVGLTAPPCLRRMRALEQSGTIRSYHADVDANAFGVTGIDLQPRRSQRFIRRRDGEHHEPAQLLNLFLLDELARVKILHLAGEPAGEILCVK